MASDIKVYGDGIANAIPLHYLKTNPQLDTYTMDIKALTSSEHYNECMGIALDAKAGVIYFGSRGKNIYTFALSGKDADAELVTTIIEVTDTFNDVNGDTFLHEMKLGPDEHLYAVAEDRILRIDIQSGEYETLVEENFEGPWGAYGIELDALGNILVGDHHGGVQMYLKNEGWHKKTIIAGSTGHGPKSSFGGVLLYGNTLYHLDFENSMLITSELSWDDDIPKVVATNTLKLPVPYPEYLQIWKGDIFVKAARENTMLRIRDNEVIQKIGFKNKVEVSPIVTFYLKEIDADICAFYGTSWGPNAGLFRGELRW